MSDIKRYTAAGSGVVRTDPKGDLVLYIDYARLKAEVEELKLENSQYEEHHKYGQNVITSLRDEVEQLNKEIRNKSDIGEYWFVACKSARKGEAEYLEQVERLKAEVNRLKQIAPSEDDINRQGFNP